MKTPRWLLHLAIIFINLARFVISCLLFYKFFLFRMAEVSALYIFYLLLDSAEGAIVFFHRDIWSAAKKIFCYMNNGILLFAVIAGLMLRLPLFAFASNWGKEINETYTAHLWLACTAVIFAFAIGYSIITNEFWGNIQNLGARSLFLIYCSLCAPLWSIPLSLIAAACILGVEIKKYGWSWKELCKKDYRFRHHKKTPPPLS